MRVELSSSSLLGNCLHLGGNFAHHDIQMALEQRSSEVIPFHICRGGFKCLDFKHSKQSCKHQEELGGCEAALKDESAIEKKYQIFDVVEEATKIVLTASQGTPSNHERKRAYVAPALLHCLEATDQEGISGHPEKSLHRSGKHSCCARLLSPGGLPFPEGLNLMQALFEEVGQALRVIVADFL